jgi:TfoX/Sxy family transcriptional regulator of competence genes
VITEWRGEGKSKQQIKEDIENFIKKKNIKEATVKDWYNINEDQVLVEREVWSGKEKAIKQKGKLRENKRTKILGVRETI